MKPRERMIRRRAKEVLHELDLDSPPIDPAKVARGKGIRIAEDPGFPPGVYGALYLDPNGFGILISRSCHGDGHRAFTVAHELGHYHIEGHVEEMFPVGSGQVLSEGGHYRTRKDPLEREADWFASELLMPEPLAGPAASAITPDPEGVRLLADQFEVSLSCAAVRFAELTDRAAAIVLSHNREIEWIAFSARMREHAWSRRAWRREWVPADTATQRLAKERDRVRSAETEASECLLCEWFDGAPEEVQAKEDCVGLGSYGRVMTILSVPDLPTEEELEEGNQQSNWRERDWRDAVRDFELD